MSNLNQEVKQISVLLSDSSHFAFRIPIYQRNYAWTRDNCAKLFEDVIECAKQFRQIRLGESDNVACNSHFIGTMVCIKSDTTILSVFDGQQRLTSIMLLLKALKDYASKNSKETLANIINSMIQLGDDQYYKYPLSNTEKKQLEKLINSKPSADSNHSPLYQLEHLRLRPNLHDFQDFYSLIYHDDTSNRNSQLIANYKYFYKEICTELKVPNKKSDFCTEDPLLPEDILAAINNITIAILTIDQSSDQMEFVSPHEIFDSLNTSGVPLSQDELLKNSILMKLPKEDSNRLYETYWLQIERNLDIKFKLNESSKYNKTENQILNSFLHDYLVYEVHSLAASSNYKKVFESFCEAKKEDSTNEETLQRLSLFSLYYSFIIGKQALNEETIHDVIFKDEKPKAGVIALLSQINDELESTRIIFKSNAPLVLCFFDHYMSNDADKLKKLLQCTKLINSMILRFYLNQVDSAHFKKSIKQLNNSLPKPDSGDGTDLLEILNDSLLKVNIDTISNGRFITDKVFKSLIVESPAYSSSKEALRKVLLHLLMRVNREMDSGITVIDKNPTIEHILPQSNLSPDWKNSLGDNYEEIKAKYLNTIGNLTLITGKSNSSAKAKSFAAKQVVYANSKYRITRDLSKLDTWNEAAIKKRAEQIYRIAVKIWPYPETVHKSK